MRRLVFSLTHRAVKSHDRLGGLTQVIIEGGIESKLRLSATHRIPGNSLPDFAVGAINLGRELYRSAVAGHPRVVLLAVPTRQFFSLLMSLGAAEAALHCNERAQHKPACGELVIALLESGKFHVAIFDGEEEDSTAPGRMRTRLRLKGTQRISAYSDRITLLRHPRGSEARVALDTLTSGREVIAAQTAFGLDALRDLYASEPASTIVGTKAWIEAELRELHFVSTEREQPKLTLGDLLLANHSGLLPPLTDIRAYSSYEVHEIGSPLTILDGANVPLRHGIHIGSGSQAVVLDATTPQATLDLAVSSCANQFAFYAPDPTWPPLHHRGLCLAERVSYLIGPT